MELLPCPFCGAGETSIQKNGCVWAGMGYTDPISVSVIHHCDPVEGQPSRLIERVGRDEESAIAAWNRRASPASVQAGYVVVPIEPTQDMQIPSYLPEVPWPMRKQIYKDMVAAAPTPPVSEDRRDAERYRWLLPKLVAWQNKDFENAFLHHTHETIEQAIDAAMQEDKP